MTEMTQLETQLFGGPYDVEGGGSDYDDDESGGWEEGGKKRSGKRRKLSLPRARKPARPATALARGRFPIILTDKMTLRQSPFGIHASVASADFANVFRQCEAYNPSQTFLTSGTSSGGALTLTLISPTTDAPVLVPAVMLLITASVTTQAPDIAVTVAWTANLQGSNAMTLGGSFQYNLSPRVSSSKIIQVASTIVNGKPVAAPWVCADDWIPFGSSTPVDSPITCVITGLPSGYTCQLHALNRQSPEGIKLLSLANASSAVR